MTLRERLADWIMWKWGGVVIFAMRRHYAMLSRWPRAQADGREAVRAAAHHALDRHFNAAWPAPTLDEAKAIARGEG